MKHNFFWKVLANSIIPIMCIIIIYQHLNTDQPPKNILTRGEATGDDMVALRVAAESCNLDAVEYLVKNVVNVNSTHYFGLTSLHYAAAEDCLEVVKFLVEEGININATDAFGWTALHYGAKEGYLEIARLLLEKGANPNFKNKDKKTPLDIAIEKSRENEGKKEIYKEIINLLSKHKT